MAAVVATHRLHQKGENVFLKEAMRPGTMCEPSAALRAVKLVEQAVPEGGS